MEVIKNNSFTKKYHIMNRYKKTMMLLAAVIFVSLQAFSQNSPVDKFFNKYADDDRFTLVSVGPQMMSMIKQMNGLGNIGNSYIKDMHNIKSLRILTTDTTPQEFYREAISAISIPPFEETMNVQDKGQHVKFLVRKENDKIVETVMITADDEFTLMDITGGDMTGLINSIGKGQ